MEPKKILIVDDDTDIVETIAFSLEQEGYKVLKAYNGYEGLGVARAEKPDLIILDVMLPGKNGYEISRMIKEDEKWGLLAKKTSIIMLTARKVDDPDREEFLKTWSSADAFIYKPFEMTILIDTIKELVDEG